MVITTVLVSTVMLVVWQWHWLAVAAIQGSLFIMESVLLSAVLYKVKLELTSFTSRSCHTQ